jgi:hypothetical protein
MRRRRNCVSIRSLATLLKRSGAGSDAEPKERNLKQRSSIFITLGFLILTGCSQAPDRRDADARVLREGEVAAFVKDWGGKDAHRIAAHFTDEGNLMVPNSPAMTGKDSIAKAMKGAIADPDWSLSLQPVQAEVSGSGDLGYAPRTMCSMPPIP